MDYIQHSGKICLPLLHTQKCQNVKKLQFSKLIFSQFLVVLNNALWPSYLIQTFSTRIRCQNVVILSVYAKNCLSKWAGEKFLSSVLLIAPEFCIDETIRILPLISNMASFWCENVRFSQKIKNCKLQFFFIFDEKNPGNGVFYRLTF